MAQDLQFDTVNTKQSRSYGAPEMRVWLEECFLGVETPIPIGAKNGSGERQVLEMSANGLLVDVAAITGITGDVDIHGAFGGLTANAGGESLDTIQVTAGNIETLDQEPTNQPTTPAYITYTLTSGATTSADVTFTTRGINEYGQYQVTEYTIPQGSTSVTTTEKFSTTENTSMVLSTTEASTVTATLATAATGAVSPSEPQVKTTSDGKLIIALDNSQPIKTETSLVFDGEVVTLEAMKVGWDGSNNTFLKTTAAGIVSVQFDSAQPISATDLDIRDLTSVSDSVEVLQDTPNDLRTGIFANTAPNGSGTWYVPLVDSAGHFQIDVVTLPTLPAGDNNIGNVDIVTLPGTVESDITAIKTAVEILDNAISGNEMQVDIVSMPDITATDLDIRDLSYTQDSIEFWVNTVKDGSGTSYIPVCNTDGELIVEVASITVDLDHTTDEVTIYGHDGSNFQRITTDSAGHLQIDVLSTPIQSDITAIKTAVEIIDNAISGNEMQVDIVDATAITGGNTLADLETTLTNIETAIQILDNIVSGSEAQVDIVAALPAGTNQIGYVGIKDNEGDEALVDSTLNALQVKVMNPITTDDQYTEYKDAAVAITGGAGSQVGTTTMAGATNNLGVMLIIDAGNSTAVGDIYIQDPDGTKIWKRRMNLGFFSETKIDVPLIGAVVIGIENGVNFGATATIKLKYEN